MGWDATLVLLPYGERHRIQRRLLQPFLTPQAIVELHPIIHSRVQKLLQHLRDRPDAFMSHIHECVYNINLLVALAHWHADSHLPLS
jgi:cytochrome P450